MANLSEKKQCLYACDLTECPQLHQYIDTGKVKTTDGRPLCSKMFGVPTNLLAGQNVSCHEINTCRQYHPKSV